RPRSHHRRGAGRRRGRPPRPRGDGGARRIPVRLLHPRLHLLDGRRILPARTRGRCRRRRCWGSDHHCGPNGFDLHSLSGNLCRCTGYRPIRDAAYALGQPEADDAIAARREQPAPASAATDLHCADTAGGEFGRYRRPATLTEALEILAAEPDVTVVAGATDWGVEVNIKG